MRQRVLRLLLSVSLTGLWHTATTGSAQIPLRAVIVVRQAEKATAPKENPPLSPAGAARAQALLEALRDAELTTIITTDQVRTRETAAPLLAGADFADAQVQASLTAFAAPVEEGPDPGTAAESPVPTALPQLHGFSDGALGAASLAGIAIGLELPVTRQSVPAQGLDPSTIGWEIDRDIVGHPSTSADQASDVFLLATVLGPPVLALVTQPGVHGFGDLVRRPVVLYGESLLLAEACVQLLKPAADRARPFTYLPAAERPSDASYDVSTRDAFVSMPSGHSALGFAAAAYAATDNLLARPGAGTAEHIAVASVGALLAGFTGNLRIRADQHFPTDALVGSLIGTASGVTVPMLHRYLLPGAQGAPHAGGHAWLVTAGGYVVGAAVGVGLSSLVY